MKKLITLLTIVVVLGACTKEIKNTKALFSHDNLPQTNFTISTDRDTFLIGELGTTLSIKKNSFVDREGRLFHGQVTVDLKEAVTDEDIIMGNMTTQTNGELLQTGGMFCVTAKAGNNNLSLAANSSIGVSVPTKEIDEDMLVWNGEPDSTGRINWKNPKDVIIKKEVEKKDSLPSRVDSFQIIQSRTPVPPAKPKTYNPETDMAFRLVFDTADFPELASYKNVHFKLLNKSDFLATDSTIGWFDLNISQLGNNGVYQLAFSTKVDRQIVNRTIKATPVFEPGADYDAAMKEYQKKFARYTKKKAEIESARIDAERKRQLEAERFEKEMEERQKQYEAQLTGEQKENYEAFKRKTSNENLSAFKYYSFDITNLGFFNCDRLYNTSGIDKVKLTTNINDFKKFDAIQLSIWLPNEKVLLSAVRDIDGSLDFFDTFGEYSGQSSKLRLPIGKNAIVSMTGIKDDVSHFDQKMITIKEEQEIMFSPVEMSKEKIKNKISSAVKS